MCRMVKKKEGGQKILWTSVDKQKNIFYNNIITEHLRTFTEYYLSTVDYVLRINFAMKFFNEAWMTPNCKGCFSFVQGSLQICPTARHLWWGWDEYGQMGQKRAGFGQICRLPRAKLKHVLWLGDLKAWLKNSKTISAHNTSSNHQGHIWLVICEDILNF